MKRAWLQVSPSDALLTLLVQDDWFTPNKKSSDSAICVRLLERNPSIKQASIKIERTREKSLFFASKRNSFYLVKGILQKKYNMKDRETEYETYSWNQSHIHMAKQMWSMCQMPEYQLPKEIRENCGKIWMTHGLYTWDWYAWEKSQSEVVIC